MAAGRPILMAVRGDAVDLIETAEAGVACIPENANSIAATVEKMASLKQEERDEMGQRGARFYQQELSLAVGARRFEKLFNTMVHNK